MTRPCEFKTSDREYAFDIIIYATGFDAITGAFDRIDIRGIDGVPLKDLWQDGPQTYLGVLVEGFPNMLMVMGPHAGLGVAEQAAVLDLLSKGRLRLGLGRGLARREFAAFRMSMDESRECFDEAAPMIVEALKTGFIEGDGKFYKQPRVEIRPRPQHSFDGRIYAVASSEDSVVSAAKLGAHMVMFADRPWEMRLPVIERGRELHHQIHGTAQPCVMLTEFVVCGPNLAACKEEARKYQGKFVESNFYHYEFLGEHFKTVKGYDAYQQKAEIARKGGLEGAIDGFMKAASWGTPDKILRGLEERREVLGEFELNVAFRFGGTPYDVCERGLRLFAKEVLPVLKAQPAAKVRDAAE
jgi:alkanesulfonate monooxygenase SsuD/methylene tetrahydromethanopterin reductase-like flavin-dependent oxidoreductase (luciferase family)